MACEAGKPGQNPRQDWQIKPLFFRRHSIVIDQGVITFGVLWQFTGYADTGDYPGKKPRDAYRQDARRAFIISSATA